MSLFVVKLLLINEDDMIFLFRFVVVKLLFYSANNLKSER